MQNAIPLVQVFFCTHFIVFIAAVNSFPVWSFKKNYDVEVHLWCILYLSNFINIVVSETIGLSDG